MLSAPRSWSLGLALGALLLAALATTLHRRAAGDSRFAFAMAAAALCAGAAAGARAHTSSDALEALPGVVAADARVEIEGTVSSMVEEMAGEDEPGSRFRLRADRVDGHPADATLSVSIASGATSSLPGDVVRLSARLRPLHGTANPGVPDPTLQARAAGIDAFVGVGKSSDVTVIGRCHHQLVGAGPPVRRSRLSDFAGCLWTEVLRAAVRARRALGHAIDREVEGPARDFLHTAVLGERHRTDSRIEDGFRAAGATHVLSVSGLHLAVIALVFFAGARWLMTAIPGLPLRADPAALAGLLTLPAVWFYAAISGAAVATVRSALMMSVVFAARIAGRRSDTVVAIAVAALVLMLQSPLVIFDVSFQLSMCSVAALALLIPLPAAAPQASENAPPHIVRRALRVGVRWAGRLLTASLIAGATTAPLVAHHFGEFAPAGPLGNLLLVPLVESATVPFGLAGATLGATIGAWAGAVPLRIAGGVARVVLCIADQFRLVAPVVSTRIPNRGETAALMMGTTLVVYAITRGGARRRALCTLGATCIALGLGSLGLRELVRRHRRDLVVTFLDVGQGDSAVVEIPGGPAILIDGGGTYDGSFDPGARIVEPFLRARGIVNLAVIALSHPHPDHMGGLHRIVQRFDIGALWTSGDDGHNPDYRRLLEEAGRRHIATPVPVEWRGGGVTIEPLGPFVPAPPPGGERIGAPEGTTVNDASLVLRISMGSRSVLFTGDLEAPGEGELRGRADLGQAVTSDLLKVPHHGSRTSSSDELLDSVRPRVAVMSLGWRNRFHFPNPEVLERYRARGIRVLRTDLDGAVTVTIAPRGEMEVQCARGCSD